jgi:hypothetical protein
LVGLEEEGGVYLVVEGKRIRFVTDDKERESSSKEVPVLLGESGDAIIGAGIVRRLRSIDVFCCAFCSSLFVDTWNCGEADRLLGDVLVGPTAGDLALSPSLVGLPGES